jgi:predicted MFS family arabinose efflux permease
VSQGAAPEPDAGHWPDDEPAPLAAAAAPTRPEDADGFVGVLRRVDFRLLWAAQVCSQLADKFLMFTLLVLVYTLTGRSTGSSLLMVAYTLPSVLLSAPAGVYADRHDKRTLMLGTNILRGGLIMLIPLSQHLPYVANRAWPLLVITLLFSAVGQVFAPAEAASLPFLVRREQIMTATSLFMTTAVVTLVVGVPLATISVRVLGATAPFYVATALFAAASLCIWRVRTSLRAAVLAHAPARNIGRELREGVMILGGHPALRIALGLTTVALIVVFSVFGLGPAYMSQLLRLPPTDTYLLLIPLTGGLVGSALVLGRATTPRDPSRSRLAAWSMVASGAALLGLGLVPGTLRQSPASVLATPSAMVLAVAFGWSLGALLIPVFTVLQERTDEATRGRIFGGIFTIVNAAVALPLVLAGGFADGFGVARVVSVLGGGLLVAGVVFGTLGRDQLRVLDVPARSRAAT